ncbi:MAG: serine/threonine-protein phosphatase [Deltaproteobacteria bacterium]|nr:serine/threonine-protein phosphatase [Deltaproteobacteria bacterium]
MRLCVWGLTDVGMKRDHNEDALLLRPELGLFAVADGMGGHMGGDQASRMAVEVLERELRASMPADERGFGGGASDAVAQALSAATQKAGQEIYDRAAEDADLAGMGTTLTSLLIRRGRAYFGHVGDSRAYLLRDNRLVQVTVDHSWIEEQVRAGLMTPAEAQESALRHIVTRSVGFEREVMVDLEVLPVLPGDCFLLCSDGLSNYLDADELRELLNRWYFAEVPTVLVGKANQAGGDDNITVAVVYLANDGDGAEDGLADLAAAATEPAEPEPEPEDEPTGEILRPG